MKVLNKSEQFQLTFNARDVFVPEGLSDEFPNDVAYHIQYTAEKWGKDIRLISNIEEEKKALKEWEKIKKVEVKAKEVEPEAKVEEAKPEVKVEEIKTK